MAQVVLDEAQVVALVGQDEAAGGAAACADARRVQGPQRADHMSQKA